MHSVLGMVTSGRTGCILVRDLFCFQYLFLLVSSLHYLSRGAVHLYPIYHGVCVCSRNFLGMHLQLYEGLKEKHFLVEFVMVNLKLMSPFWHL